MKKLIALRENGTLKNKEKAITLIALIVTIIVLLILAGVTVATLTGENGLLSKAETARNKNDEMEEDEKEKLSVYEDAIKNLGVRQGPVKESTLISNVTFEPETRYSTMLDIKVIVDVAETENVAAYYLLCEDKVVDVKKATDGNVLRAENLEYKTGYKIKTGILDIDGNVRLSETNTISTLEFRPIPLEYPIITADGVKNCKDEKNALYFFENENVTNARAVRNRRI